MSAASNAANKRWRDAHPEQVRARNKKTRDARGKETHAAEMKAWRKKNPRAAKNADLKKKYSISVDDYERIAAEQNGCCAACKRPPGKRALAVDHCHETGLVRGLLCHPCNTALGLLRECAARMDALKGYINQFTWLK